MINRLIITISVFFSHNAISNAALSLSNFPESPMTIHVNNMYYCQLSSIVDPANGKTPLVLVA